jgi:flagellar biosynthesis protein FlhF
MLQHRAIKRLLVVNAASQGETIEDVLIRLPRRQLPRRGAVQDRRGREAGPALDALIRHKLKVIGVANGQRVPEDWHRLSARPWCTARCAAAAAAPTSSTPAT